jgi:hypothetical protein
MKVSELFEEQAAGSLSVTEHGSGYAVTASSKSGPIIRAVYDVYKAFIGKKGVSIYMKSGLQLDNNPRAALKLLDNRPQSLVFKGVDKADLEAAAAKAVAKIEREEKSRAKHKADAPKRKSEASKYAAEKRKKDMAEYEKKYGKGTWGRVTYKQEGGDDGYQYVLRVDGRSKYNGLSLRQAMYEKERAVNEIAKREGLGKYAKVDEGMVPGQKTWKDQMREKGAVLFKRDTHGGGTVDRIVAYDEDGKVIGGFNLKAQK